MDAVLIWEYVGGYTRLAHGPMSTFNGALVSLILTEGDAKGTTGSLEAWEKSLQYLLGDERVHCAGHMHGLNERISIIALDLCTPLPLGKRPKV